MYFNLQIINGGKFNEKNLAAAKELGYTTVFWSLAYVDWDVKNQPDYNYAMEKLKSVDEVAYVRFASVYRQFKDINTFMDELSKIIHSKN